MNFATKPAHLTNLLAEGRALLKQHQFNQAAAICREITNKFSENAGSWLFASEFSLVLKDPQQALTFIDKSLSLQPESEKSQLQKVKVLFSLHEIIAAKEIAEQLIKYQGTDHLFMTELAKVLIDLELINEALYFYQQAVKLQPDFAGYHYNLAATLRMSGDSDSALEALDKTIKLDSEDYEALQMRSSLKKQTNQNNNISHLEQVLALGIKNPMDKIFVLYALAKEYEDIGNCAQSFKYLNQGAALRKQQSNYQIDIDIHAMTEIAMAFPANSLKAIDCNEDKYGHNSIFILGLPRTGSTLVERILSSHSEIHSAGELDNFKNITLTALTYHAKEEKTADKDLFKVTKNIDFKRLGEAYYESIEEWQGKHKRIIDKHPMNSQFVGYIHSALPKAKIIHVQRNPIDTCYAIYKNLFANAYPFSYCLDDIATFYIEHHQLMQHWYKTIPEAIYTINYEDLVNDFTNEAQNLLKYCELDWQEQCLNFHKNTKQSTTASASQVREKVYSSSINQWQKYEQELQPLIKRLKAADII